MRKIFLLFIFVSLTLITKAQVTDIATARTYATGTQVTISGVCQNGQELGNIRYINDGTGSMAVFGNAISSTVKGDVIQATGTLSDYFGLLELSNITTWQLLSSGNNPPSPIVSTPLQLNENLESHLVQINGAVFTNAGGIFAGNANYAITANGESGQVRIAANTNLVGTTIPTGAVSIVALCSQYQSIYQLLPRDTNDLFVSSAFYITNPPTQQNISSTGFDVNWETNLPGSTFIKYGITPNLELGILNGTGGSTSHSVSLSGASPSQVYYVQAYSVNGNDTASSALKIYMTSSLSSGVMKVYFNKTVDNNYAWSPANYAVQLPGKFQDTIAAYINRAQQSLDIAIYNFDSNNTGLIIQAINDAYARGVTVRIIYDGGNTNNAITQLNASIEKLPSPTTPPAYYGIMHNKFVIIDAHSSNADLAYVISGSTNFTDGQLNTDANNMIIIQDKSLAIGYTMEFEEMWGSNTAQPNAANSKFGPDKTDNTPHEYLINGSRVESYFSPSDNVNNQIINAVNSADNEMEFALLVFTRFDIAFAAEDRIANHNVTAYGMVEDTGSGGGYAYSILQTVMGNDLMLYNHNLQTGLLHHKYLIVDQGNPSSDPLVLTGSHNWSTTANQKNDENTLVVHNRDIANQYYQEFVKRFTANGGVLSVAENKNDFGYALYPNPATNHIYLQLQNTNEFRFRLFDMKGAMLMENIYNTIAPADISLEKLKSGCYVYQIQTTKGVKTGKLLINQK